MMMITPGITLYLLCPNFIPFDPPGSWISMTKHCTLPNRAQGHSFLLLGFLVWAISQFSVYLIYFFLSLLNLLYSSVDLLISLNSWLSSISPVHQAVESLHINYHGIHLLHLSSIEWRSCCDLCRAYRWHTMLNSGFSTAHPAHHSLCLLWMNLSCKQSKLVRITHSSLMW